MLGNRRGTNTGNVGIPREPGGNPISKPRRFKGTNKEPSQRTSGFLGNRGEPASKPFHQHGKQQKTNAKNVGFPREPEGTSVQSLARGSDSTQEPTQKTSGSLGNRGEPASKPSHQHGKPQKTNTKNVGFPREPEGTSVQTPHQHGKQQKTSAKNAGFPREPEGTSVT